MKPDNKRQAARKFKEFWLLAKDSETGGYSKFWLSLLSDVLGVDDVFSRIDFQSPVPMKGTTKYLDAWIPETRVLIEHKSRGIKLDAPQSGHGGKTPFEQAVEYNQARGFSEKARWIVTCNFDEIWVYDMDKPLAEPQKIRLADLPKEVSRLGFLVDSTVKTVREEEKDISIKAGRIVGELYRELLKRYADPDSPETLKFLNRLCVRLVFLFYAEDADLFPKDSFWTLLKNTEAKNLRRSLLTLFRVLDTPESERDPYLEPEIAAFPYTNGGLFKGVDEAEIPPLDDEIKELLIKSSDFDWRDISPTIFGALFESTLNPVTRRAGGMVYTSVENIHKVIDPLFLGELTAELGAIKTERTIANRRARALAFQEKLGSLTFLDPACGSGNFLTETFLSLRRLENEAIQIGERLKPGERLLNLDGVVKVSIEQFHGIEINDFAVSVAKTAMWISEAKMLQQTAEILAVSPKFLPLHDYDGIVEGNALRMDWGGILTQRRGEAEGAAGGLAAKNAENAKIGFDYIMGNPPFVGARMMAQGSEQKKEIESLFGDIKDVQDLDYVCGWYRKAAELIKGTNTRVGFVSTNSISQGSQVPILWGVLFGDFGVSIDYAWRTFKWDSEASEKAAVHCVIVGFSSSGVPHKRIYDGDTVQECENISPYLLPGDNSFVTAQKDALCDVPKMNFGNQPRDGGFFILSEDESAQLSSEDPAAAKWIRPYVGADEFIKGHKRFCLWLKHAAPSDIKASKFLYERVQSVRDFRLASKAKTTNGYAKVPHLFAQITQPDGEPYLLIPSVSSERRRYIPIGYMTADSIASNAVQIVPNATLYQFGVLTSSVHMAWMRAVAGRLEMRYRYSKEIVYNTFPWPDLCDSASLRGKVEMTAQAILDVRAKFPNESFANLYDETLMPVELRKAHAANDRAVLAAYGLKPDTPEPEIVAHLFGLYAEATKETERTEETKETEATKEGRRSLRSLPSLSSLEGGSNG